MAWDTWPPAARPFSQDKPTLLISWWITALCAFIILLRLAGRYIRVERLFNEDKIAALALIPLFLRMAFVHPVLVNGTNNAVGFDLEQVPRRELGSKLVIVCRVLQPTLYVSDCHFRRLLAVRGDNR